MTDGKTYALDDVMPFKQYDGMDESALITAIAKSLNGGGQK
jgi:hypothetical protein